MKEDFISFLWRYSYAQGNDLYTVSGEKLQILNPGYLNTDSGPDFSQTKIMLGRTKWVGNVEFHIKSSDWYKHKHDNDKMYDSVVLHVVWEYDKPVLLSKGEELPTLELKDIVDKGLLNNYEKLLSSKSDILCSNLLNEVSSLVKVSMLDRSLVERLDYKMITIESIHQKNGGDWQETAYSCLLSAFGFSLNKFPFLEVSSGLKYQVLSKHLDSFEQVVSLLFNFSNVSNKDDIGRYCTTEYKFLGAKYDLLKKELEPHQWKYFRVRPSGFPSVRMFQVAKLLFNSKGLRSVFFEKSESNMLFDFINKEVHCNAVFDDLNFKMTKATAELLMINAVLPFQFLYGRKTSNDQMLENALKGFELLKPEKNKKIRALESCGLSFSNSAETQAGLHLINNYCEKKRCLDCMIGMHILKRKTVALD